MPENSTKETGSSSEEKKENTEVQQEAEIKKQDKKSPVRLITLIVLILFVSLFTWYVISDRHTPYTDQARVNALVVPIVLRSWICSAPNLTLN